MEQYYWVMDGRANYSIDKASVLETCDTLTEAMVSVNDYGSDTCIVEIKENSEFIISQELVYSLLQEDMIKNSSKEIRKGKRGR